MSKSKELPRDGQDETPRDAPAAARAEAAAATEAATGPVDEDRDYAEADEPPPDPAVCARVKVRGTKDDAGSEEILQVWEKGVRLDAAANGGVVPPKVSHHGINAAVRLTPAKPQSSRPPPSDTESELNGLIAECRFLMREVAFASACLTYDPGDRIRFLSAAESMARTAATIGDTVGRLRGGGAPVVESRRHELVYTHVQVPPPSPLGEAKSEKQ